MKRHILSLSLLMSSVLIGCAGTPLPVMTADKPALQPQSDFPQPPSWAFPQVIESARLLCPKNAEGHAYNRFGLAYPMAELESLAIATLPADQLQHYADVVTCAYPDALSRQLPTPSECESMGPQQLNQTSLANFAYISLHAKDRHARQQAALCLSKLQPLFR